MEKKILIKDDKSERTGTCKQYEQSRRNREGRGKRREGGRRIERRKISNKVTKEFQIRRDEFTVSKSKYNKKSGTKNCKLQDSEIHVTYPRAHKTDQSLLLK